MKSHLNISLQKMTLLTGLFNSKITKKASFFLILNINVIQK